ncbi:N-acetylmuramoyl-L-alanine amidase [Aerococcus urinaeequi]|uniref:N-acetylmuramoyl-L-alanine amidase n=1 Tax=Aerococcus urinaeequi TaxID=51665 RepID=A0AAE9XI92_9LACT|nr:N-acetylmuramoyl-L-alanine amidase [Aerococcus urinaeequi]WCG37042.1 N-acetylmuramoyl-L-alanine amidase [Aerococcus urinaeequi]
MAKIGLDIGHGKDTFPGSGKGVYKNGKGYAEFDFNQRVGKLLYNMLVKAGHVVILGQPFDSNDVPLTSRTNKYNDANVDLVASIHADAHNDEDANGRYYFYWHTDTKGKKLAQLIAKHIKAAGHDLRTKDGSIASVPGTWTNFHMVRETKAPAILGENGFMTGNKDFDLIFGSKKDKYARDVAEAYFKGIQEYFGASTAVKTVAKTNASKSINQLAQDVIDGKHGSGDVRKKSLGANYNAVQARVNEILLGTSATVTKSVSQLAQEVLDGKHGAGDARKRSLGSQYNAVQAEVNRLLGVGGKSVDTLAREVIDGKWGDGAERKNRLTAAGYNYSAVQARVNQLL